MAIDAGNLHHPVELQCCTETRDTYGAAVRAWATFAETWANIRPASGRERMLAQQVGAEISHNVEMLYRDDLTEKDRIVFRQRVFAIASIVDVEERRETLLVTCFETVGQEA